MAQDPLKPKDDGKIGMPKITSGMNKLPPTDRGGGKGSKDDDKRDHDADQELLLRARKRFERCVSAESDNRKNAEDDLRFLSGDQWPADVAAQRNTDKRPCLTLNKLKTFVHQITNDQRQNRPGINISPVGTQTDIEAAKVYAGMIRAIERESSADIAYDSGFWNAAANGFGYWRVCTDYADDSTFDQSIYVRRVRNPFTVYLDPDHMEPDGSDARYGFVTEMVPRDEFKERYPDAQIASWDPYGAGDTYKEWVEKDRVRVAEYYEIEHDMAEIVHLSNGHVGYKDKLDDQAKAWLDDGTLTVEDSRKAERARCFWYKITALDVLDRTEVPTDGLIPIVKVVGDEIDVNGKVSYQGIVRSAKDPQRLYNYWRTTEAEIVALQPKAPFVMEEGQVEGHESQWKQANTKSFPYLLYKGTSIGGKPAPMPQRQPMIQAPTAVLQAVQGAAQDMQATTGIRFDATMQERLYDESGKALREIRRVGDVGNFHYIDNFGRSLKYTGKLLIRMIPHVYDTRRVLNILREDGKEQAIQIDPTAPKAMQRVQGQGGKPMMIFNPNVGKYGVTVTIGPSFATKRIEASEQMLDFVGKMPQIAPQVADLIAKNMDWPEADQFATRLAKTLPPNLLTPDMADVSPQVQALVQSQKQRIMQLTQQMQMAQRQLQDMTADRMILADKNQKDFEAKVLAVLQKASAADAKAQSDTFDHTLSALKFLDDHGNPAMQDAAQGGMAQEISTPQ